MTSRRRLGALLLLPLLALAPACRTARPSSPAPPDSSTARAPAPLSVAVDRRTDGAAPHSLRLALLPLDDARLLAFLEAQEIAFSVGGRRFAERLLYATLDPTAEDALLAAFPGVEAALAPPAPFAAGDAIHADSFSPDRPVGVTLDAGAEGDGGKVEALRIAVLVRPADGSLLPAIRGRVPVSGAGAYLVAGDVAGRSAFVALLRLDLAGAPPVVRQTVPRSHRVEFRSFLLSSAALARILEARSLPPEGGPGGLAVHAIGGREADEVAAALAAEGDELGTTDETVRAGDASESPFGLHRLAVAPAFRPAEGVYRTRLTLVDVAGEPSVTCPHDPGETLLVVGWDAVAPGRSRAGLVRIVPRSR